MVLIMIINLAAIFMSGCIPMDSYVDNGERTIGSVQAPAIDVEATVLSLSLDTNDDEREEQLPGYEYPKDTGVIKIDKIISMHNPNNWNLDGIREGNEIKVRFNFSARPAKIRSIPVTGKAATPPETPVSHVPASARPIPREDGYFIYFLNSTAGSSAPKEREMTLPGLDIGSRFFATINYLSSSNMYINDYHKVPDQNGS